MSNPPPQGQSLELNSRAHSHEPGQGLPVAFNSTARPGATTAASFLARFTGHPAQAAFVACRERFALYVGGVGAGKTTAGAVRAVARWRASRGANDSEQLRGAGASRD